MIANHDFTSIGDLNITDYHEYPAADPLALAEFSALGTDLPAPSLETTHGIIRLSSTAPTIFISAIVNRMTKLGTEGTAAQNYTGGFNAGVAVASLLTAIAQAPNPGF